MPGKRLLEVRECVTGDAKCRRFDVVREFVKSNPVSLERLSCRGGEESRTDPNTVISYRAAHDATSP